MLKTVNYKKHNKKYERKRTIKDKVVKMYSNRSPAKRIKALSKIDLLFAEQSKPKLKIIMQTYKEKVDNGTILTK